MKKLIFTLIYMALLIALFYAVKATIDPQAWAKFWTFMAGDYPMVWARHIKPAIPSITHPITQIILAILLLGFVRNLLGRKKQ